MRRAVFRPLTARAQLGVERGWPRLLPRLLGEGLSLDDAVAVAYNTVFLHHVWAVDPPARRPEELLDRLSMAQIARLCEEYARRRERIEAVALDGRGREG